MIPKGKLSIGTGFYCNVKQRFAPCHTMMYNAGGDQMTHITFDVK